MNIKTFIEALVKFLMGILMVGLLVFIPAGTINYWQGLLLMGILFIPMLIFGVVLMIKNPSLLRKRLSSKEKEKEQKYVILFSGLIFLLGFTLSGLGYRYEWYILPKIVSVIAAIIFLLSYVLYAEVMRENTYLSRTIEVQKGQKVIDKGLYGIVRHPMYLVTILLFLMIPLILGSIYAFLIFLLYPFVLVKRIKNEEDLLTKELVGYAEYKKKVKYRIIPFIW